LSGVQVTVRKLLVALAALFVLTAVATATDSAPRPIFGVVWAGGGKLAWLDPLTLEPVRQTEFRFPAGYYGMALSADGRTIALKPRGALRVRIISAASLRVVRTIPARGVRLAFSIWPSPKRLVGYAQGDVVVLDPQAGRVVSRRRLDGASLAVASTPRRLVLLLGQKSQIGPVALATVEASGLVRSVQLPTLRAGFATVRGISRQAQPGLAIDPSGGRAAVVAPGLVVEVDLASLTVTSHRLERRRPASARKAVDGWSRTAVWAAPSTLAVTGTESAASGDGLRMRQTPAGLALVHTRAWEARVIEPGASQVTQAGRTLLATGVRCEPAARSCRGIGLRGYSLDGSLRFHLFGTESLPTPHVAGGLAYLSDCSNALCYRVVDPLAGRLIGRALPRRPTVLLPEPGRSARYVASAAP
jgi:hypothetical protein